MFNVKRHLEYQKCEHNRENILEQRVVMEARTLSMYDMLCGRCVRRVHPVKHAFVLTIIVAGTLSIMHRWLMSRFLVPQVPSDNLILKTVAVSDFRQTRV